MVHVLKRARIGIVVLIFFTLGSIVAQAQGNSPWTPAQVIPLYTDLYPPVMVADRNRVVHAFNSELLEGDEVVIFYRRWNIDQGWSPPIDILLPYPSVRGALQDVVLDPSGKFHMVFYSGVVEQFGEILYSQAWASEADQSQAWSNSVEIGTDAGPLISADLAWHGDNHLSLVYTGEGDGVALYETHSNDSGQTWTDPVRIISAYQEGLWPVHIQTLFDKEGRLHVVWGIVDTSGIGQRVYYTRREADGVTWRNPYLLASAEGNDYGADWPSIIEYDDQLIVLYMDGTIPNGIPPTRWMRISRNGGSIWSNPIQPFPHVGENGAAIMLVDSSNNLHTIFANRVGDPPVGGVWHAEWIGDQWGEPELITARSGNQPSSSGEYVNGPAASRPNAEIVQGNVILSAWWHDMRNQPPAAFSYSHLDGPEYPIEPLPQITPTPTPTAVPTIIVATATPTVLPFASGTGGQDGQPVAVSATNVLFLGLLPVLLLVVVVIGLQRFRSQSARR